MGKPGDPDYQASRHVWGGTIAEVPRPHIRWFPGSRRKREVEVSVSVFEGIGRHFHVGIIEEDNLLWDRKERCWRKCWQDREGMGKTFSARFTTEIAARRFIRNVIEEHFSRKTHKIRDLEGRAKRWFYREGD